MVMKRCVKVMNKLVLCAGVVMVLAAVEVASLNGPNVCMVQQKYNITKRVKYRAPMSVRTYEWCFSMPPRCSKWKTEMRELTKLETDERIAEVAVCCPGYKMKDVSCVPICPNGKTGHHCSEDCPPNKWGPNCVKDCKPCSDHGTCSPITGECSCHDGWQGESCENRMPSTTTTTAVEDLLTQATKTTTAYTSAIPISTTAITSPATKLLLTTPSTSPANIYSSTNTPTLGTALTSLSTASLSTTSLPTTSILSTTTLSTTTTKLPTTEATSTTTTTTPFVSTTPRIVTTNTTIALSTTPKMTTESAIASTTTTAISTTLLTTIPSTSTTKEIITTTELVKTTPTAKMEKPTTPVTTEMYKRIEETTNMTTKATQNERKPVKDIFVEVKTIPESNMKHYDTTRIVNHKMYNVTINPIETSLFTTEKIRDTTRRPESTFKYFPTTVKFKPKEIWIRPAQKGDEMKTNKELLSRHKPINVAPNTTPKTIIVSIIPTSVSYTTFKKISLTTPSLSQKNNTVKISNKTNEGVTRPMTDTTASPPIKSSTHTNNLTSKSSSNSSKLEPLIHKVTKPTFRSKELSKTTIFVNSMTTVKHLNSSHLLTAAPSTNAIKNTPKTNTTENITTFKAITVTKPIERVTKNPFIKIVTVKPRNVTIITVSGKNNDTVKITKTVARDLEKTNVTKTMNKAVINTNQVTTERSEDEETFHILTEPEHITAVMDGKGKEQSSVDLISVISIAVGIMMIVITVAVIIVMIERCRRPRYGDVRKMNDIHMQVMIDNNDVPPPYVRSIFHTPLPDPPTMEKCHYQPISTLDRNLKQFMRPVVVQTISPIMLENFRGILECHYDHLPTRRDTLRHCSIAPSIDDVDELTCLRACSVTESTIEAMKCEAKMDIIDNTTSEPLYAEIPCWRPPSEHAIEVMNHNGEAVTEL